MWKFEHIVIRSRLQAPVNWIMGFVTACLACWPSEVIKFHIYWYHWSPTVPVSVWLPEPARDRGSKQKTINDDCYHITCRSAAIFGVQTVLSYLVLTLSLWICLCPMKRSSGMCRFDEVSVTYRRSFGNHTLAGALCSGNIQPEPAFSFTTFPLFYRAQLDSVPICINTF